jgi:hypothetical protein
MTSFGTLTYSRSSRGTENWYVDGSTNPYSSNIVIDPHEVVLHNMRGLGPMHLDERGFQLLRELEPISSAVVQGIPVGRVDAELFSKGGVFAYVPQVLCAEYGESARVVPFDVTVRNAVPNPRYENSQPVQVVHVDHTPTSALRRWNLHAPGIRHAGRVLIVNIWRALGSTEVVDYPLVLADATSVDDTTDLVTTRLNSFGMWLRDKEYYRVRYNSSHRWYMAPRMTSSEALVFKIFDSESQCCKRKLSWDCRVTSYADEKSPPCGPVPHTSFFDSTAVAGCPEYTPRTSVEVRSLIFLPPFLDVYPFAKL